MSKRRFFDYCEVIANVAFLIVLIGPDLARNGWGLLIGALVSMSASAACICFELVRKAGELPNGIRPALFRCLFPFVVFAFAGVLLVSRSDSLPFLKVVP